MSTKFSDFLKEQQLDTRRLMAASHKLEQRKAEDRRPKAKKGAEAPAPAAAEEGEKVAKRRSGRPVTPRLLTKAMEGKIISGPAKTRLVRAVNYLLAQKKKDPVDMRALF